MSSILEYKGYHTRVEYDSEDMVLRGKIEGINDYVDFECSSVKDVESEFHKAVNDYLSFCAESGKVPDRSIKVRLTSASIPNCTRGLHS